MKCYKYWKLVILMVAMEFVLLFYLQQILKL